jgi:DNA-binding MarR family transcriptional regulator/GNAT superfamily N-acetyltransferase
MLIVPPARHGASTATPSRRAIYLTWSNKTREGTVQQGHVQAVRRFNRFYTREIGVLGSSYLEPGFSLTEGRVLYELAQSDGTTARRLRQDLGLDAGYLSRILKTFEAKGYLTRRTSARDRRASELTLTAAGRRLFAALDARSDRAAGALIGTLRDEERERLAGAMATIESLLSRTDPPPVTLRPHRPGDMGWVIERHAVVYAAEQGWGPRFEALIMDIVARFIDHHDPESERCWIAERAGQRVGCVFLVRHDATTAKLRLLLVDPAARGLGLGRRLVDECIRFARAAGYRTLTLWTQSNLLPARALYAAAGFRLVGSEPFDGLGVPTVSETWAIDLASASRPG